jgi:muramoyltetrapeptide carboxypeptidase LdcA involved in peptidoglycan recycling
MKTFAGPSATGDFGAEELSQFTLDHCFGLLDADAYDVECDLEGPGNFAGSGTLWGGNLALVAHLLGTPYFPRVDGGILFLEDVNEHPYRVERMLYQLHHAGLLARNARSCWGALPNTNSMAMTAAMTWRRSWRSSGRCCRSPYLPIAAWACRRQIDAAGGRTLCPRRRQRTCAA